ncbi:MAG: DUF5107 domain-containing protein [Candidatus Hydrogenedentes bacterium]|nr:DUF5107 domain-containing protein [Candidatus Hydrogenedentota bacterium]
MSELRVETYTMPAGGFGPPSPLPPLRSLSRVHRKITTHESVPESARTYLGYGLDTGILPYTIQDDYDRRRAPRAFRVAVLENDVLRATFLLEFGGRLWSIVHKPSGRELLYKNPVFQPANLAVRNAWFSGGVEWNCSIQGHSPFTCSPLFAARAATSQGESVLRLYEWERIRGVPYQLDFSLPDGSPWLLLHVRIVNPHNEEIPMYWWSNIAVPEAVRVLTPADAAYSFSYDGLMRRIPVPVFDGVDRTYPVNAWHASDAFYDIPEGLRPWIAGLADDGAGLIQTSTPRLRGRKLFLWGMREGGRRWQEFLSEPGWPYIEIQAGLARTQIECVPMPANTEWTWLEAYGLMEADPNQVHGDDWQAAQADVQARLESSLPADALDAAFTQAGRDSSRPIDEMLQRGSGWGALERLRLERTGGSPRWGQGLEFDAASLDREQAPWQALLETGEMPWADPAEPPAGWMVQAEWRALLEDALAHGRGDHWLAWLHLGVMRYHAGEVDSAIDAWKHSMHLDPSAWALRNLAVAAQQRERHDEAAGLWLDACAHAPGERQLAVECCTALLKAGRPEEVIALHEGASAGVRGHVRLQILRAKADLAVGDLDRVEAFLVGEVDVPDVREGEVTLSDLWFELQEKRLAAAENLPVDDALRKRVRAEFPPPAHLDFRMSG